MARSKQAAQAAASASALGERGHRRGRKGRVAAGRVRQGRLLDWLTGVVFVLFLGSLAVQHVFP